jgi:broad specificity phosphatase PhoE
MKIIFVRHGQTNENVVHRHQPVETPLSILGRRQAVLAGERIVAINPTHIVSSPLVRSLQTASLIANECDMIPSIDYSLVELIRPQSLTGYGHMSSRSLFFYLWWYSGFSRGGESYSMIRQRIAVARQNLERLPADATVVVVSHSVFISLFVAHVCRPHMLGPLGIVRTFMMLRRMPNTGMTEYEVSVAKGLCGWVRTQGESAL